MSELLRPDLNLPYAVPLVAIVGPTAVGKTRLVLELADRLGAEVVNLDSMQVYRHMDIGTAKPTPAERSRIRHHLLDLVGPDEEYNVARFVLDAEKTCLEISARGRVPLLTGGTGLYLKSFQEGLFSMEPEDTESEATNLIAAEKIRNSLKKALLVEGRGVLHHKLTQIDPASAARIHPNDSSRLLRALEVYELTGKPWSEHLSGHSKAAEANAGRKNILKIGLTGERKWLYDRINTRSAQMLQGGLIEEVESLIGMGYSRQLKPMQALGYRHAVEFIDGHWDHAKTLELMARDTRHYAKRQLTWFRRDPEIVWFEPEQTAKISILVERFMEGYR